jgi:hypothetical protein
MTSLLLLENILEKAKRSKVEDIIEGLKDRSKGNKRKYKEVKQKRESLEIYS